MSKLLAMMMKPKNYMYATIKGSLTENNGVFSGFSDTDYLQSANYLTESSITKYKFRFKTKITQLNNENVCFLFCYRAGSREGIRFNPDNTVSWFISRITGTSTDKSVVSSITVNLNDILTIECGYKGNNTFYIKVSKDDGLNWVENTVVTNISQLSDISLTDYFTVGGSQLFSTKRPYLCGSIDLPQSYVKINNTKYRLQAVVGYTVVGSPTITDGVVSGFSGSNYLQLSSLDFSQITNYEIVVKCKLTSNSDSGLICLGTGGVGSWRIWINTGNSLNFSTSNHSERLAISGNFVNTDYYIRVKYNNGTASLGYSTDNINYTETSKSFTNLSTNNAKINIGYVSNYGVAFNGSIDIANSYIKINNKLWFNGQPAE